MSKKAIKLDVDPSIIENNLLINQDGSDFDAEIHKYLKSTGHEPPSIKFKPSPGFCIKTHTRPYGKKVFINICHTDKIPPPEDISENKLVHMLQSEEPTNYRVPMSIGEPKTENDKSGNASTVHDVAINTDFFEKLQKSEVFHSFFIAVVFEGIQDKYQIELQMDKYVILKNKKCHGDLQLHKVMQRNIEKCEAKNYTPLIEELSSHDKSVNDNKLQESRKNKINQDKNNKINSMKYTLRKIREDGKMKYLLGEFHTSTMLSLRDLKVDIGEDRIVVEAGDQLVDIFVPCTINQNDVQAALDQNTRILTLKMSAVEI